MKHIKSLINKIRIKYIWLLGNKRNIKSEGLKGNTLKYNKCIIKKLNIKIQGENNTIIIDDSTHLLNSKIYISGNNNTIRIGKSCFIDGVTLRTEDDNNEIEIGNKTTFYGESYLAAMEGTKITIGEDCMFAINVLFQTGDAHSIINLENQRINFSKDIKIGNHVWVGTRVVCLKNTEVADNCIIGANALVCGKHLKPNCAIGGVPAKVLKENINWLRERI